MSRARFLAPLVLLTAGCGSSVALQSYLTVVAISPSGGATDLPTDVELVVTMSEPLSVSTVTPDTVLLLDEDGTEQPLSLAYNDDYQTIVATPDEVLGYSGTYTLVLTTGLTGSSSGALPARVETTFSTEGEKGGNRPPEVNPGDDQEVATGDTVQLDGTGSEDPEGEPLTYIWALQYTPDGSESELDDDASATPTFVADLPGSYVAQLQVDDGELRSATEYVQITASDDDSEGDTGD